MIDPIDLTVIVLIGGLVALDTMVAWQLMFSQPIVSCPFIGYLLGDIQTGLLMGSLTQLLWMGMLPVGATSIPESNIGSFISAALAVELKIIYPGSFSWILISTILFGIVIGLIGQHLNNWIRHRNDKLMVLADRAVEMGNIQKIIFLHWSGILKTLINGFLVSGLAFLTGLWILNQILRYINLINDSDYRVEMAVLLGIGSAVLYILFENKLGLRLLLSGLVIGFIIFSAGLI